MSFCKIINTKHSMKVMVETIRSGANKYDKKSEIASKIRKNSKTNTTKNFRSIYKIRQ